MKGEKFKVRIRGSRAGQRKAKAKTKTKVAGQARPGDIACERSSDTDAIPHICDFVCPFADFPPAETAGLCRTMSAVWCRKLKELVNKNAPCEWHRRMRGSA